MSARGLGMLIVLGLWLGLGLCLGLGLALSLSAATAVAQTGPPKPKVPPGRDPGGIAVAVIGAGVDYRQPEIAAYLARDGEGELIAWDVIDDDARPLEAAPVVSRHVPPHAGTTMAARLHAEAPASRLIPVRIPGANPLALGGALAFAAQTPARIAVLLTGAERKLGAQSSGTQASGIQAPDTLPSDTQSWGIFTDAARRARQLLIIAPAGHQGRDSDGSNLAPLNLGLDNLIVVTAADANGGIAEGASWGAERVELAIPLALEAVPPTDTPDRAAALENAAAVRLAALAARLLAQEPGLDGPALKARLLAHAKPLPGAPAKRTRFGWIEAAAQILKPN